MTNRNAWEFLISESPHTLRQLSRQNGDDLFQIYEVLDDRNDCSVGDYRFSSVYTTGMENSNDVYWIGEELLSLFNGAAVAGNAGFRKIQLDAIWKDGVRAQYQHWLSNAVTITALPALTAGESILRQQRRYAQSDRRLYLVSLAVIDPHVRIVLKYFEQGSGWSNYYKLLETVELFSERDGIELNISKSERSRFTNAANNYSATGLDGRHGYSEQTKPSKVEPMTLDEAHRFIRAPATTYLDAKIQQQLKCDASQAQPS